MAVIYIKEQGSLVQKNGGRIVVSKKCAATIRISYIKY